MSFPEGDLITRLRKSATRDDRTLRPLAARAIRGDQQALAALYECTYVPIFGDIIRSTGNRQLAEDLTQQTFLRVCDNIGGFQLRDGVPVMAWIDKIAQNIITDHHRSNVRGGSPLSIEENSEADDLPDNNFWGDPLRRVESNEGVFAISKSVAGLPKKQRDVVILHEQGMDHGEIGETLGIKTGASRVNLLRARRRIAEKIADRQ